MNWNETSINLPYTFDNLKELLNNICKRENKFSQYEFAKWCDNFTMAFEDDEHDADDLNDKDEFALGVARDIECQWNLYLINTYSDKVLQTLDLSQVALPQEWLLNWFEELNSL
ncbi:hypothetical protein [Bacillus sp. Cr_A10]|uniref:hypothetical protein n=1 Tax=Bacillus sp. Cr_A10 TaxID=3033993 RepID=UPI0023DB3B48|nr:hypothetical protein [Bacillus sp. Cr_A10]MDF2066823.1 hypothetical protein [Bacillus sp. Cr_A10]